MLPLDQLIHEEYANDIQMADVLKADEFQNNQHKKYILYYG